MPSTVRESDLETEGEEVASNPHHPSKDVAVRIWRAVVKESQLADKVIAGYAGMTAKHYSKVAAGEQGDLLGMIFKVGQTKPELRREFISMLAEVEGTDSMAQAAEQLVGAAVRFLRLASVTLPSRANRMARAVEVTAPAGRKKAVA